MNFNPTLKDGFPRSIATGQQYVHRLNRRIYTVISVGDFGCTDWFLEDRTGHNVAITGLFKRLELMGQFEPLPGN